MIVFDNIFELIHKLCNDSADFALWQSILIGLVFLIFNFVLFASMVAARRGIILEFGYSKSKKKAQKKICLKYPILKDIFMIKLVSNARKKGFILYLTLFCHWMNLLSFIISCIGYLCVIFTGGTGWAVVLLIFPVISVLGITVATEFVPHLIWIPSERRRYK